MRQYEGYTLAELSGLLDTTTITAIKEELSTRESLYMSALLIDAVPDPELLRVGRPGDRQPH